MFRELFKPHIHLGTFLLRLGLATIFIYHGCLKFAIDHGSAWDPKLTEATQIAVTWGELICGALLLVGLVSRLASIGIIVIMTGAIVFQTGHLDFINTAFVPPHPRNVPVGYEYNFALIMMSLAVLAIGSGKVSLDYLFFGPPDDGSLPQR